MDSAGQVAAPLPAPTQRRHDQGALDALWRFFTSLRLTAVLAVLLALASALCAFGNPEDRPLNEIVATAGGHWWFPAYRLFEVNDVAHAGWLLLLLVTLALNLAARTAERLPQILEVTLRPDKLADAAVLREAAVQQTLRLSDSDPQRGANRLAGLLRARGFLAEVVGQGESIALFAERGRFSRFGEPIATCGLLLILGGVLVGRTRGVEGSLNAPGDGSSFDSIYRRTAAGDSYREPLGFAVRIDAFRLKPDGKGGAPLPESDLTIVADPGTPKARVLLKQTIRPGHPLDYRGWTIAQSSSQAAPDHDRVKLHILDKQTRDTKDVALAKDGEVTVGEVTFKAINYTGQLAQLGPAVQLQRSTKDDHTRFWVLQGYPDFDTDNRGDRYGLRFDGLEPFYLSALRFSRDPGVYAWIAGSFLFFLGLGLALSTSHRRIWAKLSPGGAVTLAGVAYLRPKAFAAWFQALSQELAASAAAGRKA